jgi:hypothetical protein
MITFLKEKLQRFLLVILVIIGITFIFFGQWTPNPGSGPSFGGVIDGRTIRAEEFQAAYRGTLVIHTFRTGQLAGSSSTESAMIKQTWSRLIALSAAREAGLEPTDAEVLDAIRKNPLFHDEKGVFSPDMFKRFDQIVLSPQGITYSRFHQLVREELAIQTLLSTLGQSAVLQPGEAQEAYERLFGKTEASVVEFKLDAVRSSIQPTEEQLLGFHSQFQGSYVRPETRSVEVAEFKLPAAQAKLTGDPKQAALTKLGETAYTFSGLFTGEAPLDPAQFAAEATKAGATVSSIQNASLENPSSPLLKDPSLLRTVFALDPAHPVSDYLASGDTFLVFRLKDIQPSSPLAYEEVKARVREDYIRQRARFLVEERASAFASEVRAKMAAGASWKDAVTSLKLTSRDLPAFAPASREDSKNNIPDVVRFLVQKMNPGEVSGYEPTADGGVVVHLRARKAPDASTAAMLPRISEQLLAQRRGQMIDEWLNARLASSKTKLPPGVADDSGQGL